MKIEVDTSSRLDKSGDTVFSFSNDIQRVALLKQTVRNECLERITGKKLLILCLMILTIVIIQANSDEWEKKADIPTPRRGLSACAANGKIYAIGGCKFFPTPLSSVEEYTPDGWLFSVSNSDKLATTWGNIRVR